MKKILNVVGPMTVAGAVVYDPINIIFVLMVGVLVMASTVVFPNGFKTA